MNALLDTISALDAKDDFQGLHARLQDTLSEVHELILAAGQFLISARFQSAYLISKRLHATGIRHPVPVLAQAIGGLLFGDPNDELQGRAMLVELADNLSSSQQGTFFEKIVQPVTYKLTDLYYLRGDIEGQLRLLEILRACTPQIRHVFDFQAKVPRFDLDQHIRAGRERSRVVRHELPPAGMPREHRRVIVAMREMVFPGRPGSRRFEVGPRITAGMNLYGWTATGHGFSCLAGADDYGVLTAACREQKPDVLVIDDHLIQVPELRRPRAEMIALLRKTLPSLKIVSLDPDPWELDVGTIREAAAHVDVIWTGSGTLPVWSYPDLAQKVFVAPWPPANIFFEPTSSLPTSLSFTGSIKGFNYHRVYWQAASKHYNLPIDWRISTHEDDGLPVLDSYAAYVRRIADAGISLNFSMRPDLTRITTGRVFETIFSGALLVTEYTPDDDSFLVQGEHYLAFSTFAELRSIIQFIAEQPEAANAVRRRGYAYAREHYSDEKIIGYLDHMLYHRR